MPKVGLEFGSISTGVGQQFRFSSGVIPVSKEKQADRERRDVVSDSGAGSVTVSESGVRVESDGGPVKVERKRGGVGYLLLDTSSSMSGDKLDQAKRGTIEFAREARLSGYVFGLICFNTYASQRFGPEEDLAALREAIEPVEAQGSTNMSGAIVLARRRLRGREEDKAIVIATDGMPDSPEAALNKARETVSAGIDLITVGTDGANRNFLQMISSRDDLAVTVDRTEFEEGITSTARMLPGGKR